MESKDLLTANEVMLNSGLNFEVESVKLYDCNGRELDNYRAIQRKDTGHTFQVATAGYNVIQNHESLSLLDEIVGSGLAKYSGTHSFKNGAVVGIRAEVPMDYNIAGDEVKSFIHVFTSHDGTIATQIIGSQQRFICKNLIGTASLKFKFRHTRNYRIKISEAQEVFANYRKAFQAQKEAFQNMAKTQMTQLELDSFLNNLLEIEDIEEVTTRKLNIKDNLSTLFVTGIGHDKKEIAGTRWAAYNAVTEYVDHHKSFHGNDESNREYASIYGSGAKLRDKAYSLLVK